MHRNLQTPLYGIYMTQSLRYYLRWENDCVLLHASIRLRIENNGKSLCSY